MEYSAKEAFFYAYANDGLYEFSSDQMRQFYGKSADIVNVPMFIDNDGNIIKLDVMDTGVPNAKLLIENGTKNILVFPGSKAYPANINIPGYTPDKEIIPGQTDAIAALKKYETQRTSSGSQYVSASETTAGGIYFLVGMLPDTSYSVVDEKNVASITLGLTIQGNFFSDYQKPAAGTPSQESSSASVIDNSGQQLENTNPPSSQQTVSDVQTPGLTMDEGRLVRIATWDGASGRMVDASNSGNRGAVIQHEVRDDGYLYDTQSGALLVTPSFLYYKYDTSRQTTMYVDLKEKDSSVGLWLFFGGIFLFSGLAYFRKKK